MIVQGPNGEQVNFPDGTDPNEISRAMRVKFGGPSDDQTAFNAGREAGQGESGAMAAIGQAAQQGTFGLNNYVNAGARWAAQRFAGVRNPDTFSSDLAMSRGRSQGEIEASPTAGTVGGVLGGLVGGGALGVALKAARLVPGGGAVLDALAPKAGQKTLNVVKAGLTSAAGAGVIARANGASSSEVAQTEAISAVGGPLVGKLAGVALARALPVAQRAMTALSAAINESPDTIEAAYQSFHHLTGSDPTMAQLMGLKSQGLLKKLAAANHTIGEAASVAANAGGAPLAEQLATLRATNATRPQTAVAMDALRDAETDRAMNLRHPVTGLTLNTTPAPDAIGHLLDPRVEFAMNPNLQVNSRIGRPSEVLDRIAQNTQTIGDIDVVRKALRDQQNAFMRPAPGSTHARDPLLAKEFGDLANKIEGIGVRADPDYGKVLNNYRGISRYTDAFQHGLAGNAMADVPRDDTLLQMALKTPMGEAGYKHGNALHIANAALDAIAPGTVHQAEGGVTPRHLAQGAMAALSGPIGTVYHALQAFGGFSKAHLSDSAQQIIAKQLNDPRQLQQGIANLRRARATDDEIRRLSAAIGGTAGARIADFLTQPSP